MSTERRGYIEVDLGGAMTTIECDKQWWTRRYPDLQAALTHAADMDLLECATGSVMGTAPVGISPRVFVMTLPDYLNALTLHRNGFTLTPMRSGQTGMHAIAS
jgi:hypothetical protein